MAGIAPNVNAQITRRLAVMHEQLDKVYAATGTRSIKQLKEFIFFGRSRHPDIFLGWPSEDNGISRSLILNHPENYQHNTQQEFRVQHVNGKEHLFATEKIISDWEHLNLILLQLDFPRQYIPEAILAELEAEHAPYSSIDNRINPRSSGQSWIHSLPNELYDTISDQLSHENWIDVEELFENANRLRELRELKRGLRQGPKADHPRKSLLLNLPVRPANLVGTFVTGARRNEGLNNLNIAGQEQVLIDRLTPKMPVIDVGLPEEFLAHYEAEVRANYMLTQAFLDRIYGPAVPAVLVDVGPAAAGAARTRKRKTRNRKTRKNRK